MLRPDIQNIIDQFVEFRIHYTTLESKCRRMEEDYHHDIADINRAHADQIMRMEEEIEILRSQFAAVGEFHRDEIRNIERRYEKEKSNLEGTINVLKGKINELQIALDKSIQFNTHPALRKVVPANRSQQRKTASSNFKWPSLEVQTSKASTSKLIKTKEANAKKKRKLYCIDEDSIVDITA